MIRGRVYHALERIRCTPLAEESRAWMLRASMSLTVVNNQGLGRPRLMRRTLPVLK